MKTYVVEGAPARFGAGTLVGLTRAQYEVRAHNIEGAEEGVDGIVYGRARAPIEFKVGEQLLIEGDPPRAPVDPLSGLPSSAGERRAKAAAKRKPSKGRS